MASSITVWRAALSLGFADSAENEANRLLIAAGMPVVPLAEKFVSTEARLELNWSKWPNSEFCWRTAVSANSFRELCCCATTPLEELSIAAPRPCRPHPGPEPFPHFNAISDHP